MDLLDWFKDCEVGYITSSSNSYIVRLRPLNTQSLSGSGTVSRVKTRQLTKSCSHIRVHTILYPKSKRLDGPCGGQNWNVVRGESWWWRRGSLETLISFLCGNLHQACLRSFFIDATGCYQGGVPVRIRAAVDQGPGSQLQRVCTHCPNGATVQERAARGTSTLLARGTGCGRPLGGLAFGTYFQAGKSSPESSRRRNRPAVLLAVQPECPVQPALCGKRASLALHGW